MGICFRDALGAILVDSQSYLLELSRYVVLNPVRVGIVASPADWAWSSYRASLGLLPPAPWLAVDGLLAQFAEQRVLAQQRYAQFVAEDINADSSWKHLNGQVFLGDDAFVQRMQANLKANQRDNVQIPVAHRRAPPLSLQQIANNAPDRNTAIAAAYATGAYSYQEIADYYGVHFTTVGRVVRKQR